jgi:hypothetical protein
MQTDATGRVHSEGIPPQLIRPEVIAALRRDAEAMLPPIFTEIVRTCVQPLFQPIGDLESPMMRLGRVALLGDARSLSLYDGYTRLASSTVSRVSAALINSHVKMPERAAAMAPMASTAEAGRDTVMHGRLDGCPNLTRQHGQSARCVACYDPEAQAVPVDDLIGAKGHAQSA